MRVRLKVTTAIFILVISTPQSRTAQAAHVDCEDIHAAAFLDEPAELQQLFDHGANMECRDAINQTPLITATDGASFQAFSILLRRGANIHARDEIGETALDKAKQKLDFFDMQGGEAYHELYQQMIAMLIAKGAAR